MQQTPQQASPFKNWKQLVVLVALAFIVPVVVFILITQWVTSGKEGMNEDTSAVLARIAPVGQVELAGAATPAASAAPVATATPAAPAVAAKADGKKIYDTTCAVCHGTGVAGAPKFGDKKEWAPRLATGIDMLYKVALAGKGAMPAKGGNTALPDADVKAAVDYMTAAAR